MSTFAVEGRPFWFGPSNSSGEQAVKRRLETVVRIQ
jgi:hypothetical protein